MEMKEIPMELKEEPPERNFTINNDGTVIMDEILKTKATMKSRDFLTFYREHEKVKNNLEHQLSKEYLDTLQKSLDSVTKEMERIKPFVDESEEKARVFFEEERIRVISEKIKEEIVKSEKEQNIAMLSVALNGKNLKGEPFKDAILSKLTEDEKTKLIWGE